MTRINAQTHPVLVNMLRMVDEDGDRRPLDSYDVPDRYDVGSMEALVSTLSEEQQALLAVGERGECEEWLDKNKQFLPIDQMLNDFFNEDWNESPM